MKQTQSCMQRFNRLVYFKVFGHNGMEAYFLDSYLEIFEDGNPRDNVPSITGELVWTQSRVTEKLLKDEYLKTWGYHGGGFVITAEGKLHLDNGGYKKELIHKKISRIANWISILAFIMSIWAFIRTF